MSALGVALPREGDGLVGRPRPCRCLTGLAEAVYSARPARSVSGEVVVGADGGMMRPSAGYDAIRHHAGVAKDYPGTMCRPRRTGGNTIWDGGEARPVVHAEENHLIQVSWEVRRYLCGSEIPVTAETLLGSRSPE